MEASHYRLFGTYRCALALAVVVSHSLFLTGTSTFVGKIGIGNIAVMAFFILSGFIIAEAGSTFYKDRPFAFLLNRFWRIAPPYWLALSISISAHYALAKAGVLRFPDYDMPPSNIFETRNIVSNIFTIFPFQGRTGLVNMTNFYGFVRFYWAILAEVEFYCAAFTAFFLMVFLPRWRSMIAAGYVLTFLSFHLWNDYVSPIQSELTLVPYFLLGVCLYGAVSGNLLAKAAAIPCFIAAVLHFLRYTQGKIPLEQALQNFWEPVVLVAVDLMAAVPIIVVFLCQASLGGRPPRLDKRFGDLSYPIYLNHFVVLVAIASVQAPPSWTLMAVAIIASVLLSWAAAVVIETPLKPLRDRIRGESL